VTRRLHHAVALAVAGVAVVAVARVAGADIPVPSQVELPQALSLDAALQLFRSHGLDVLIADANTEAAEGQVLINNAVPNPQVSASVGNAITYANTAFGRQSCLQSGAACSPWTSSVGVTDSAALEDTLSGKRGLRVRVAQTALAAAKMSRRDAERTLAFQVKAAYAQVAVAQLQLRFARDTAAAQADILRKFRARYEHGNDSEMNLELIEVAKLEADQAVAQALDAKRTAQGALAVLLGVRGVVPDFDVDDRELDFRVPAALQTASEQDLLGVAWNHRPDLVALGYQRESSAAQIALVRRQRFPDITLGLTYSFGGFGGLSTNGPVGPEIVSFSASLPLPIFYNLQGEERQAHASYDTSTLQEAKTTAQVADDIAAAYAAFQASKDQLARMEGPRRDDGGILESARGAYVHAEQNYFAGNIGFIDYRYAYQTWIATKTEEFNDKANYWTAIYQLEAAVAKELR
jgi:cobalt-zinc-cadmium efflux system outer membrane protein